MYFASVVIKSFTSPTSRTSPRAKEDGNQEVHLNDFFFHLLEVFFLHLPGLKFTKIFSFQIPIIFVILSLQTSILLAYNFFLKYLL